MLSVERSNISGFGVVTLVSIPKDTLIGVWLTNIPVGRELVFGKWFESPLLGRYCNHSYDPNTMVCERQGKLLLRSESIQRGQEVFVDYRWASEFCQFKVDLSFLK